MELRPVGVVTVGLGPVALADVVAVARDGARVLLDGR
jgi:hypothetical protein